MIDSRIKLMVLKDSNGTFSDHSEDACDFTRDDFSITLSASTDYLYVGFRKPIAGFYVELTTPNTNANTLSAQYYNGSSWVSLDVRDETKGLTRSGYISFDRTSLNSTSVNGSTLYWARFRPSTTHTATSVRGLNLVFSDDASLRAEFPEVTDSRFIPEGQSSHILAHQAARDEIVQDLRKRGYIKYATGGELENVDQWDLIDVYEIKRASVYKALANIFFSMADSPGDKWYLQYGKYADKYQAEINGIKISVDQDDNGQAEAGEKLQKSRITRWAY